MKSFVRIFRSTFQSTCKRTLVSSGTWRASDNSLCSDSFAKRLLKPPLSVCEKLTAFGGGNVSSRRRYCDNPEEANSFHVQDYDDFKERVLQSEMPVVVDFFADWCGPCKLLAPRLESMVDRKNGRVILAKVNVDDNTELAMEYGVRSVPTVIAFKGGQPVDQMVGLSEDEQITSFLNKLTNE